MAQAMLKQRLAKVLFWSILFSTIFIVLAITADVIGYQSPVVGFSKRFSEYMDYIENVEVDEVLYEFQEGKLVNISERGARFTNRTRKTHVALLKVHKAGSTTMQNMFFRFGLRHNLNIVLPKKGNYVSNAYSLMALKPTEHYDIFALHTVYNKQLFDSMLPKDYVNIGIVREPVDRMISAAYYYRYVWNVQYLTRIPKVNFIHNLVNFPSKYETKSLCSSTKNTMGCDFGFPKSISSHDKTGIRRYLDELNSQYSLVLTVEKFNESLVLMRRMLNWSIKDIIYLQANSHKHNSVLLNKTEIDTLKKTSFLDFEIFNYFSERLTEKLKDQDSDFWEEVNFFKDVLNQVSKFCGQHGNLPNAKLTIKSSKWDDDFKISTSECVWMKTSELSFIKKLRTRHVTQRNDM